MAEEPWLAPGETLTPRRLRPESAVVAGMEERYGARGVVAAPSM